MTEIYNAWKADPTISKVLEQLGLSDIDESRQKILEQAVYTEGRLKNRHQPGPSDSTAYQRRRALVNAGLAKRVGMASIIGQVIADALASQDFTGVGAAHHEFDEGASHRGGLGDISIRDQD